MYVESCTILVVVNRLSRPVVVLDGLPGLYGMDYRVYMGTSMTVRPLAGCHCTCTLINWSVLRQRGPPKVCYFGQFCHNLSAPRCYVGSLLPPRLHLCRPLSWFDPRAHVGRSSLYIPAPATLLRHILHKSFEKTETLIILRVPPYSRA